MVRARRLFGQQRRDEKRVTVTANLPSDALTAQVLERWAMTPFPFKPIKHNALVVSLARLWLGLRASGPEKVIFTATTGRSGTLSLAKLFAAVPGCRSVHEGHPVMNGSVLRAASYGDVALVNRVYRRVKSINILRAAVGYRYYLEANHLFIKTFIRNAIDEFGDRLCVIHLVRPALEVATSIYQLRDCPGTERGNYWWLEYHAPTNLIQIARILETDPEFSHPFYKALWYWHEIEARVSAWRVRVPTLNVTSFETRWLNDLDRVCGLLDSLGMAYERSAIDAVVGRREHAKEHEKNPMDLCGDQLAGMELKFRKLLESLGYL
jgi:hypothetical protein